MAFDFDPEILKKHPYATGGIVIVGGIIVFYFLSKGSSGASASPANSNYSQALAADTQLQEAQAQLSAQSGAQQAQTQQAQIAASVANNQTAAEQESTDTSTYASLIAGLFGTQAQVQENQSNNTAGETNESNYLQETQNTTQMQDQVLEDNINASTQVQELGTQANLTMNAENDQYQQNIASLQAEVGSEGLADATQLETQQQTTQGGIDQDIEQYVTSTGLANAPNQNNLNSETTILEQELAGGNPTVAIAGQQTTQTAATDNAAETASIISSLSKGVSSVATGLF